MLEVARTPPRSLVVGFALAYSRDDAKLLTAAPALDPHPPELDLKIQPVRRAEVRPVPQGLTARTVSRYARASRVTPTYHGRLYPDRSSCTRSAQCCRARRLAAVVKVATSTQSISTRRRWMFSFPIVRRRAWRSPRPSTRSVALSKVCDRPPSRWARLPPPTRRPRPRARRDGGLHDGSASDPVPLKSAVSPGADGMPNCNHYRPVSILAIGAVRAAAGAAPRVVRCGPVDESMLHAGDLRSLPDPLLDDRQLLLSCLRRRQPRLGARGRPLAPTAPIAAPAGPTPRPTTPCTAFTAVGSLCLANAESTIPGLNTAANNCEGDYSVYLRMAHQAPPAPPPVSALAACAAGLRPRPSHLLRLSRRATAASRVACASCSYQCTTARTLCTHTCTFTSSSNYRDYYTTAIATTAARLRVHTLTGLLPVWLRLYDDCGPRVDASSLPVCSASFAGPGACRATSSDCGLDPRAMNCDTFALYTVSYATISPPPAAPPFDQGRRVCRRFRRRPHCRRPVRRRPRRRTLSATFRAMASAGCKPPACPTICTDTCTYRSDYSGYYASNGLCDDGGPGSGVHSRRVVPDWL